MSPSFHSHGSISSGLHYVVSPATCATVLCSSVMADNELHRERHRDAAYHIFHVHEVQRSLLLEYARCKYGCAGLCNGLRYA